MFGIVIIMIVNTQKKIEFINDCECIVDYNELEKAILWYQDKPTSRLKHIYMFGEYPAVTIFNKKIHIHRLLMEYWLNTKLPRNYYVHHINENKLDARKENLSVEFSTIHQSHHNKGKITPINFNKGSKNPKSKLNEKEVLEILKFKNKGFHRKEVYIKYKDKISYKGFENIWYRKSWKELFDKEGNNE